VDRQTPFTARVDIRERAIGKLCSLLRTKRWHAQMIARTGGAEALQAPNDPPTKRAGGRLGYGRILGT
jgi:hypothetical protein